MAGAELRHGGRGVPIAQTAGVGNRLVTYCNSSRLRLICFVAGAFALLSIGACRSGMPVFDPSERPATVDGTISGVVRGPQGTSPVEAREVAVINVDTGERQKATTNAAGGFSFKVKPGKYRVELALLQGEMLVKRPGVINVNRSDVDAHADFVLGGGTLSRPRFRAPRTDDGLGSPIA